MAESDQIGTGAIIRVVPDGRHRTAQGADVARISLVLMPDPRVETHGELKLHDWPQQVAARVAGGIEVLLGRRGEADLRRIPSSKIRVMSQPRNPTRAARLWRRIFDRRAN